MRVLQREYADVGVSALLYMLAVVNVPIPTLFSFFVSYCRKPPPTSK